MARTQLVSFLPEAGVPFNQAASLAYYLSRIREPFPFPVKKVGQFLGMSAMMGTTVIKLLQEKGVIALAKDYDRSRKLAKEFVFVGEGLLDRPLRVPA
jgi:hypothetical protein